MAHKYMVLKLADLRTLLSPEEQEQFNTLMQKLKERREQAGVRVPHYFVLNMNDKYAISATEKYMEEIDLDDVNRSQAGVKDARKAAWDSREWALNNTNGDRVPT